MVSYSCKKIPTKQVEDLNLSITICGAIIQYHKPCCLNHINLFSPHSGAWGVHNQGVRKAWLLLRPPSLTCRHLLAVSPMTYSPCVYIPCAPFYKFYRIGTHSYDLI